MMWLVYLLIVVSATCAFVYLIMHGHPVAAAVPALIALGSSVRSSDDE